MIKIMNDRMKNDIQLEKKERYYKYKPKRTEWRDFNRIIGKYLQ